MDCSICKDLERTLESRRSECIGARSAASYAVSTELVAYKNVEMERAKSNLEEHQLVCGSAASGPRALAARPRAPAAGRRPLIAKSGSSV